MNIAIVNYDLSRGGGSERVAVNLANKFSESMNVSLISIYEGDKHKFDIDAKVKKIVLVHDAGKFVKYFNIAASRLLDYCLKNDIDIMLSVGLPSALFCVKAKLKGVKLVVCVHTNIHNNYHNSWRAVIQRLYSLLIADRFITLTKRDAVEYKKRYPFFSKKIRSIHNWIDDILLQSKPIYNMDSRYITTICRIDRVKGLEESVKVAKIVNLKKYGWKWLIYGTGDKTYLNELKTLVHNYNLDNEFIFCGRSDDIKVVYPQIALYVSTSKYEGLPMSLLEAKAYKIPIVSFNYLTGPEEIIQNGINGYLIDNRDINQMADVIIGLINDKQKRIVLSQHAWDNISNFAEKEICKQWIQIFKILMQE